MAHIDNVEYAFIMSRSSVGVFIQTTNNQWLQWMVVRELSEISSTAYTNILTKTTRWRFLSGYLQHHNAKGECITFISVMGIVAQTLRRHVQQATWSCSSQVLDAGWTIFSLTKVAYLHHASIFIQKDVLGGHITM